MDTKIDFEFKELSDKPPFEWFSHRRTPPGTADIAVQRGAGCILLLK